MYSCLQHRIHRNTDRYSQFLLHSLICSATCQLTNWITSGTCSTTACASLPVVPNAMAGDCVIDTPSGSSCVPVCNTGFIGTISSTCMNTVWTTTGTCTSTDCTTLPVIADAGAGDCLSGSASGTTCKPVCNPGFGGTLSGMYIFMSAFSFLSHLQ